MIIYKYRDWNNRLHRKIITRNEIFFSSPKTFNDPFDCRITQSFDLLSKDEIEEYKQQALISQCLEIGSIPNNLEVLSKSLDVKFLEINTAQLEFDQIHDMFHDKNIGIFSCSKTWKSLLMWSHYVMV